MRQSAWFGYLSLVFGICFLVVRVGLVGARTLVHFYAMFSTWRELVVKPCAVLNGFFLPYVDVVMMLAQGILNYMWGCMIIVNATKAPKDYSDEAHSEKEHCN